MAEAAQRKRVLFIAEDITRSQVVRLFTLASSLDPAEYDVHFACSSFDPLVFEGSAFRRWHIDTLPRQRVFRAMHSGRRLYATRTLARYIESDLRVMDAVQPDAVVGDFRLSLPVSAPLRGVPLLTLINAYWSPFAARTRMPLPEHPMVRLLGVKRAREHFPRALPWVFDHFAAPVNKLRKRHGLSPLGSLPDVLTWGDQVLYPDVPSLVPTQGLPSGHHYIGPVLWSPRASLPGWWERIDDKRPLVYLTLGSSGNVRSLPALIEGLARLPVEVVVSTAGETGPPDLPAGVHVANYVPGNEVCARASLVVSNGGSSTSYQALNAGVPVLGVPENLDQYLAMSAIEGAGAGILLRSGTLTAGDAAYAAGKLLIDDNYRHAAARIADDFHAMPAGTRFEHILHEALT